MWCCASASAATARARLNSASSQPHDGVEAAMRLLEVIARRGRDARARDILAAEGIDRFAPRLPILLDAREAGSSSVARIAQTAIGRRRNRHASVARGSLACGVGLAFGHADAASLEAIGRSRRSGRRSGMRAAPGRALIAIGLSAKRRNRFRCRRRTAWLHRARRRSAPARHRLRRRADLRVRAYCRRAPSRRASPRSPRRYLDGSFTIHISGCAKGCAHPAPRRSPSSARRTAARLIANGSARDAPFAIVAGR